MAQNSSDERIGSRADNPKAAKETKREEASRLTKEAKGLGREAADLGSELVDDALETGRDYAARARSEAGRVYEVGQKRAEEAAFYAELGYEETAELIRRHPAQAMGLAVGVGVLIGMLITRR
ncbi:DUF883 family protein [Paracoccus liaowanqingii]|uniref:DUF883 family protein n=1 Tax=Paracoccus liaowanqingii TaxID=2560053 RepID=A0A4Z1C481_9RHOB|nr:DUF883 family protein [Paracoccus liaowanqingii]TGN61810.1 DUF883 family protein [Paracoccus liaowanqingii]